MTAPPADPFRPGFEMPSSPPPAPPPGVPLFPGPIPPSFAPHPAPPPRPGHKGPSSATTVVVAILAAVAMLAGVLVILTDGDDPDDVAAPGSTEPAPSEEEQPSPEVTEPVPPAPGPDPAPPATETGSELDVAVADISAFVEQQRGLEFIEAPLVELAADAEFEQRLLDDFEEERADIEQDAAVLRAVGLLDPGVDLVEAFRSLLGAGVIGFYDPETGELVVRGDSVSPYVRGTIAHELTHALDDQHFELERPEVDDSDGEESFGFVTLVEGNAATVEDAYVATFDAAEHEEYLTEQLLIGLTLDVSSIPPFLIESISAPYLIGPVLVDAIRTGGGQGRLDEAFGAPPITSEQVLDPARYLAGEGPVPISAPPADGDVVDQGAFGAFSLRQVLESELFGAEVDAAIDGWGGDAYVAWADGGSTCLRATFVGDTPGDTAELARAISTWAVADGVAEVSVGAPGSPVTFTRCG